MKLLVLTREYPPYVLGGISYYLLPWTKELSKRGHDVTVVTGMCPQCYHELDEEPPSDIAVHTVQFGLRQAYYLAFPAALRLFLNRFNYDDFDAAIAHTQVPFDLDIPTIMMHHDCLRATRPYIRNGLPLYHKLADSLMHRARCWIDQRAINSADHVIFNSHLCESGWRTHYDVPTRSSVIHNGVDVGFFRPRPTDTDPYILFVGNDERKGLSRALEYAPRAELPVHLVGLDEVDAPGAVGRGRVSAEELPSIYSDATVTIHPTDFEAFGNVVLESIACGTPVVTTEQCGAAEILDRSCAVITDDIEAGVTRARRLDAKDCVSTAKEHEWPRVADRTLSIVEDVLQH